MFSVVYVISFSTLHQQLLRSLPIAHVTEITCHLFRSVQFDFKEGNFESSFGINYCYHSLLLHKNHPVLLKLIDLDCCAFCKRL